MKLGYPTGNIAEKNGVEECIFDYIALYFKSVPI